MSRWPRRRAGRCCRPRFPETARDRRLCLLDLEDEGVLLVVAEDQVEPGAGPDASDADDLVGRVGVAVYSSRGVADRRGGSPVVADQLRASQGRCDRFCLLAGRAASLDGSINGGSFPIRALPSTIRRSFAKARRQCVDRALTTRARPPPRSSGPSSRPTAQKTSRLVDAARTRSRAPASWRLSHRLAVSAHGARHPRGPGRASPIPRSRPATSRARRQPLDVPLPWPRQGLVESLMSNTAPLRRPEPPEVREMGVAAALHLEARTRRAGEIGGHDRGRPR